MSRHYGYHPVFSEQHRSSSERSSSRNSLLQQNNIDQNVNIDTRQCQGVPPFLSLAPVYTIHKASGNVLVIM